MHSMQGARTGVGMHWSAAESARQCGVSRATIDRAIKAGKLAAEKDDEGAWRISPHALIEAGLNPGKPSPPDPVPVVDDRDQRGELERLRTELSDARADSRVLTAERDAERYKRESAERERDVYRRMIEGPSHSVTAASQTVATPGPTGPDAGYTATAPPTTSRWRRAWNILRS